MHLLSWRKTNFLCIISILSRKSMSKLINVNCLHFICCKTYWLCSTTILSKHIKSALIRYARAYSSCGCFILRAMRLSNKLLEQGYVKEHLKSSLRKFYCRYRDLIKQYEVSLSQMLNDILWTDHIQRQPPTDQTLYRTRPFTEFWVVSIEHLRRVWHADRGRLLLRTPGPTGLAYVLLVETNPFPNLLFFRTILFEYPSVLSRFYLLQLSKIMLWSKVKLLLVIVMSIILVN